MKSSIRLVSISTSGDGSGHFRTLFWRILGDVMVYGIVIALLWLTTWPVWLKIILTILASIEFLMIYTRNFPKK